MTHSHEAPDYFKIVDLNPAAGAVTDPRDPRALHYFGFESNAQALVLPFGAVGGNPRVLFSFDYDYFSGGIPPLPQLPVPGNVRPHGVLTMAGGPAVQEDRYDGTHLRRHVLVWLDPAGAPQPGQPVEVHVGASRRE